MRIITGSARGIALETPPGEATRPTSDRVKEALFSMIQFDIEGRRVLDLFAGSGQLGLEALSRGAALAVFIDSSREAIDAVMKNAAKTKLKDRSRAAAYDFKSYLGRAGFNEKFDIIFLDPPYNTDCMTGALELIASAGALAAGGSIVCETDTDEAERKTKKKAQRNDAEDVLHDVFSDRSELAKRFSVVKTARYGRTRITILTIQEAQL